MEENKIDEEKIRKSSLNRKVLYIILAALAFVIIILSVIKANYANFKTLPFIISIVLLIIISSIIYGIFWYLRIREETSESKLIKESKILPKPITRDECLKIINKIMFSPTYADYLSTPEIDGPRAVGKGIKSWIYEYVAEGKYKNKDGKRNKYYIFINMHYPEDKHIILVNPNTYEVGKARNDIACFPSEELGERIVEEENMLTGNKRKVIEKIKEKPEEDKKEHEDLIEK